MRYLSRMSNTNLFATPECMRDTERNEDKRNHNFFMKLVDKLNSQNKKLLAHSIVTPVVDVAVQKISKYIYMGLVMYSIVVLLLLYLIYIQKFRHYDGQ